MMARLFVREEILTLASVLLVFVTPMGCKQAGKAPSDLEFARSAPDANTAFEQARALERAKDLSQAALAYHRLLETWPDHGATHHRLAVVNERLGRHQVADQHYQEALKVMPNDIELLTDHAYSLLLRGDFDGAERQLKLALAQEPNCSRANAHLALVRLQKKEVDGSLLSFRAAGCSDEDARANVVYRLMLDEDWSLASQCVEDAIQRQPTSALLQQRRAEINQALAQQNEAKRPTEIRTVALREDATGGPIAPASYAAPISGTSQRR
jgi:Tfp pilus assembly protein PilF